MAELTLIPREEFERAKAFDDLALLADMCRANALVAVKRAGSGHLGCARVRYHHDAIPSDASDEALPPRLALLDRARQARSRVRVGQDPGELLG